MTQYVNLEQENLSFKESNGQLESELQKCYENIHDLSIKLPKSEKDKGEALKEDLWQIRSYLPEVLRKIRSYLPEVLRKIGSYLPEVNQQIQRFQRK